ncbi:hypothetical protein C1646_759846 [Rhizophagus diaphanus]|nr:hypothetical protein C1646_759846 [Rhizophagus diaphanus] [Rhizophagus sp. MUCL 43196]
MSSSADNVDIILHCLIVPCGELHALPRDQVVQTITVGRSQAVSDDFDIIENERVDGLDFFDLTEEKLERHRMKMGPATRLVKFAKDAKRKS